MFLLPPKEGLCQFCAVVHAPDQPHNPQSLYYQVWFKGCYGREATWADAMAHCSDEIKQCWIEHLTKLGIDINSTNLVGDNKTTKEVEERLEENGL